MRWKFWKREAAVEPPPMVVTVRDWQFRTLPIDPLLDTEMIHEQYRQFQNRAAVFAITGIDTGAGDDITGWHLRDGLRSRNMTATEVIASEQEWARTSGLRMAEIFARGSEQLVNHLYNMLVRSLRYDEATHVMRERMRRIRQWPRTPFTDDMRQMIEDIENARSSIG